MTTKPIIHIYTPPKLAPADYDATDPWYANQFCAKTFGLRPLAKPVHKPNPRDILTPEQKIEREAWAQRVIAESASWPLPVALNAADAIAESERLRLAGKLKPITPRAAMIDGGLFGETGDADEA